MDDDFSDDGFDDLNDNVLQELENNAIQFTQAQKLAQSQQPVPAPAPVTALPKQHQYQHQHQHQHQHYNQHQHHLQRQPHSPSQFSPQPQSQQYGFDLDDDDLDDTVVIDELAPQPGPATTESSLPPQHSRLVTSIAGQQRWNQQNTQAPRAVYPPRPQYPPQSRPRYPPPRPAPPPPLPSQRYPRPPIPTAGIPHRPSQVLPQSQFAQPLLPQARPYPPQPSQGLHGPGTGIAKQNDVTAALQARLSALEAELTAAKGEASILRSKYDKATITHDAELARLKKQNAEQLAQHERMVESAIAAERTAATELQFARQDLKAELGRAKSRKKDGTTTPKRNKTWGQADGFDGIEIMSSPSKGQQKRKDGSGPGPATSAVPQGERTPSKGKRKRPAVDSPSFALETHSDDVLFPGPAQGKRPVASRTASNSLPFDFLRVVLDHSSVHNQPLTFDLFSRFAFPSEPSQTFASTIFQKLPQLGSAQEPLRLLTDFAELMIDMWQQCLSERYHAPIYYLAALVSYTLQLNATAVAPHIVSSLVPVCATTCRLVALPRFNSVDGNISDHPDSVVRQLLYDIDVTQSLSLLYMSALACLSPPSTPDESDSPTIQYIPQTELWKGMELEFVMMMLSPKHPESDWFGMLSLLWTSVLPTSIGPIPNPTSSATYFANGRAETETADFVANGIIDRVSSFLAESPRWAPPGSAKEVAVRLAVLKTLILFATSDFGFVHLASSDVAIPRLVTVLCWGIDKLYDVDVSFIPAAAQTPTIPPEVTPKGVPIEEGESIGENVDIVQVDMMQVDAPEPTKGQGTEIDEVEALDNETDLAGLLCRLIAQAMRLLHTLVTDSRTANMANITAKLAASQGGSQRYLITLARLNFSEENLILERGIDQETVDLAHELLELAVTPDEGEGVGELFV